VTMSRVEVITSVQRRRRWSRAEKELLVAATLEPGVTVSEVSQTAGIHSSQLFRWRKELCRRSEPSVPQLVPVKIAPAAGVSEKAAELPPLAPLPRHGMFEIDLGGGRCVRVDRDVDAEALCRVLDVLGSR
jgi:transposase